MSCGVFEFSELLTCCKKQNVNISINTILNYDA
jgi:hypothetical protein